MLHQIGLLIHMCAIVLIGGGSLGVVMAEVQFWKKIRLGSGEAKVFLPIFSIGPKIILTGGAFFLTSGLVMLYAVNWIYLSQPWFIAKFLLFLSLPIRGATIGKKIVKQIGKLAIEDVTGNMERLMYLKRRLTRFHIVQFSIVLIIVFLVIFKL